MRKPHARTCAVVAALVLILVGAFAPPAEAAGPVSCTTALEGQRVENDLVVPNDGHCFLDRTTVAGDVTLGDRAELDLINGAIEGDLTVGGGFTSVEITRSQLHGGVRLTSAESTFALDSSAVWHSIRGITHSLYLTQSRVDGAFSVAASDVVLLKESTIGGWVSVVDADLHVDWSTLRRGLSARWTRAVQVCGSTIAADLTLTHSHGVIGIGATLGASPCYLWEPSASNPRAGLPAAQRDAVSVGATVQLLANRHSIVVRNTTIAGDLACSGNTGRRGVSVADTQVAGTRTGQCTSQQ